VELSEAARTDRPYVERYGPGGFHISGEAWTGSVIILPDRTEPWPVSAWDAIDPAGLVDRLDGAVVELLLVGCGATGQFIPQSLRAPLRDAGIVLEAMDTGAACRTYNLLAGEGRAVAAALIALPAA